MTNNIARSVPADVSWKALCGGGNETYYTQSPLRETSAETTQLNDDTDDEK
jgi:hypothetical protein